MRGPEFDQAARFRGKHFSQCRTDWLLFKLQLSEEHIKEMALKASVDYRSCPTGQDEEKEENIREKKWTNVRVHGRSITELLSLKTPGMR